MDGFAKQRRYREGADCGAALGVGNGQGIGDHDPLDGSVSKVEMAAPMAFTYKPLFSSISTWLLLDSRVVEFSRPFAPTFATLSSLNLLFFNGLRNTLRFSATGGA
jgi:hypothetical protein